MTSNADLAVVMTKFLAETTWNDLPEPVVERVKKSILDVIGVGIYGSSFEASEAPLRYAQGRKGPEEASLFCNGGRTTAFDATLLNGTYVHVPEFAEGFTRALVHPGNMLVPAVLAVAEREHRSGRDVLAAVAVAYEFVIRWGFSAGYALGMRQGLHPPAFFSAFGSAAGIGRLLGYDADRTANLLGIAACHVPTTLQIAFKTNATVKDLFQGYGGAIGVLAADLDAAGIRGVEDWLVGWHEAAVREYDFEPLTKDLGDVWHVASGGIRIKTRPVLGMCQPTMEATYQLLQKHEVDVGSIDRIVVESSRRIELSDIYHPTELVSGRASIPFLVSAALVRQDRFREDSYMTRFLEESFLDDPDINKLQDKVELVTNPEFDYNLEQAPPSTDPSKPYMKFEARVTITLDDGTEVSQYADMFAIGTGMMDRDRVADKFRAATDGIMPAERAEKVIDAVWNLDTLEDAGDLLRFVAEW